MVLGRFLQGVGGGGLVPATLALVADLYPAHRRGVPLGVVGAVQELGSVLGPLYGAVVLALADWRAIFWVNLTVGLVLLSVIRTQRAPAAGPREPRRWDVVGSALLLLTTLGVVLVMVEPAVLTTDVTVGLGFLPVTGDSRWLTPVALVTFGLAALLVVWCATGRGRLLDLRGWPAVLAEVDVYAAGLLALALGGVVIAFATADPAIEVFSPAGPWLLVLAMLAAAGFWWRNRTSRHPLVPAGALGRMPAWGALVVSFFVGSALIAALVDIPVFARVTVYNDDQLAAALVLVRMLVALPVGAVLGGWLTRRVPAGVVTAVGMACACVGFVVMSRWGLQTLEDPVATVPLVLTGLGFGLALAPVNAALLAATEDAVHGVASALLVVARMVGMLVGISALTTIGLRRYYAEQSDLPAPMAVCGHGVSRCKEFSLILQEAGLTQLQTIFLGAAVCSVVAGVVALVVFRHADTREIRTSALEAGLG
jgi:MFS family permease